MISMRKLLFVSVFIILSVLSATAQLQGDGSLAHPYSGFLAGDFTISGTKYFNGNIYVDNETLTIAPGTKLIAVQIRASIFVTDSGRLIATGSAISPILFTCDTDLDGITGEPEDSWGDITITSSGNNQIGYCTFERGRKDHVKFGLYGGGLRLASSTVTVTYSTFRYCYASKGGAIAILSGASPTISGCTFLNNSAIEQGGAVYIEAGSSPVINNSLFSHNSSSSVTLKGGTFASISSSPRLVNSTIVYSTSPVSDGTSLYLENSSGAIVVNTAIWGGTNHVGLSGTPSSVLVNNAIEGATFAGNLTLNSSNTASDGPNFKNPVAGDFSITYVSPMRDTGVSSYPGITIPTVDILRNARIYIPDIGAYEAIYSRWNGSLSTSWSMPKNWEGAFAPGVTNIVIPAGRANYPTATPGPSFTLNAGLEMIMEPGSRATFTSLTNNGTIEIKADATGIASLLTGSYSGAGGSLNVELYLTGAPPDIDRWHYIAAPITVSKTVFTDIEPYNLMLYDESKVTTDVIEGWQWHDGYDGTTPFSNLEAKRGYDALVPEDTTIIFSNLKSLTTSMGQINLPFSGSGLDTALFGYSLIGNSLTCGMNWDMVSRSDPTHVRNAIYITKDNTVASYVNGVGTNGGSAHIPPLQGFFVKTRATGTYITIPDNAREHNATPRYKSSKIIPIIRLTLASSTTEDETVVRLEPLATTGFDNDFDAGKIFSPVDKRAQIYSVMNREDYSINSIPWPKTQMLIPLTLKIPEAGSYMIRRSQLQGIGNLKVLLTDGLTGKSVDLLNYSEYSFTATKGTVAGRFSLVISAATPDTGDKKTTYSTLKIYSSSGKVCVLPQGDEWDGISGKVRIFDITGRLIMSGNEEWFSAGELKEYLLTGAAGLLVVEVTTGTKRYLEKVVLTRK
jgi:predicted outer membrane repeat protein